MKFHCIVVREKNGPGPARHARTTVIIDSQEEGRPGRAYEEATSAAPGLGRPYENPGDAADLSIPYGVSGRNHVLRKPENEPIPQAEKWEA